MKLVLMRRDFTDLIIQPELDFEVGSYTFGVFGGPLRSTITASGGRDQLFALINHLRAPVELFNDLGECVWWGYLASLSINWEGVTFSIDVDSMSNDVAVAYTEQNLRYTTQWSSDADSVAEYGEKEILLTIADATATDALQRRDTYLAAAKHPIPSLAGSGASRGTARITCRGWINTLDWKYYTNLTGKESYEDIGQGGREIGEDDRPILAQSFQIGAVTAWPASGIWIRAWKEGAPADNLVVTLHNDVGGSPGSALASGSVAGADIADSSDWIEFVLNTPVTLQPATTYWISVGRSGAVVFEGPDFFMVDTNFDAGYPRGTIKLYNTNLSAWAEEVGMWGDLLFKVVGNSPTTEQITTLVTSCGQFLTGTIIENASGVNTNPYRDGDSTALYELEQLLLTGTTNDRRLLCEVTRNRYLRVYEEPAKPAKSASYALDKEGVLKTRYMTEVDQSLCPVGVWAHLADVIPATVDLSLISDPNLFLIEEAEVNGKSGDYSVTRTRNQTDIWSIGGTGQG